MLAGGGASCPLHPKPGCKKALGIITEGFFHDSTRSASSDHLGCLHSPVVRLPDGSASVGLESSRNGTNSVPWLKQGLKQAVNPKILNPRP